MGKLGWIDGRNIRIDYRWGAVDIDRVRTLASELVGLRPDGFLRAKVAIVGPIAPWRPLATPIDLGAPIGPMEPEGGFWGGSGGEGWSHTGLVNLTNHPAP